ncbi:MAG TPA: endolytic transglycosylase MltG [Puia sp.]|nr:endolytic transglycosylase MltG [Puia sp.]
MIRKILLGVFILIAIAAIFIAYQFFGSATAFEKEKYFLYIKTGMTYDEVVDVLRKDEVIKSPFFFKLLSDKTNYSSNVKAGKYEIKKGTDLVDIIRMLKNGRQVPVNLVITKFRTKENLASSIGKHFECDSTSMMDFLENTDTLKRYGLDSNTAMTAVFPDTYTYFWNTTPSRVFKKFFTAYQTFWTEERKQEAKEHSLTPASAYILASIIEEETNKKEDKPLIASTYLNRISKGMKLSADPTIKFAMKNFELKRIYEKYLSVESPYNTYKYTGLPPGPICTPSQETIDAVLTSPKTNYLYFVAKADFSGYSNFSETFEQHLKFAKEYQKALDIEMEKAKQQSK